MMFFPLLLKKEPQNMKDFILNTFQGYMEGVLLTHSQISRK